MKNWILFIMGVLVAVCVIATAFFKNNRAAEKSAPSVKAFASARPVLPLVVTAPVKKEIVAAKAGGDLCAPEKISAKKIVITPAQKKSVMPKEPIQDPDARAALSLVGADPEAEAYWVGAINDPHMPANERKDLIEDLNEDGLSDPQHPGPEDMPLIFNRIQLIQELASSSMDQVNADAFQEAYKDLVNLAAGRPAQ